MFLICSLLLIGYAVAQPKSKAQPAINFLNKDLGSALQLAKQLHKPVFVDAYTNWCAPCQELKKQTFTNKQVAAYFNTHYINIAIDVEQGAGVKFADQYAVDSYPTLLFIDENGQVIKKTEGFVDAKQLLAIVSGVK